MSALCHDELFFAKPVDFNDPFDCSPVVQVDSGLTQLRALLRELVAVRVRAETLVALDNAKMRRDHSDSHAELVSQREAEHTLEYIAYHSTNPDYDDPVSAEIRMLGFEVQLELQRRYEKGICCFSQEYNNPLLWSHYGDQHRGLCIGYTTDRLPRPDMKRVQYGGNRIVTTSSLERAIINKCSDAIEQLDANVLLRKAPEWSYEQEWRLVGRSGSQESPLKLTEITFGLRCPGAVQHSVIKALEGRQEQVAIYEIRNVANSFLLERAPIDMESIAFLPETAHSAIEIFCPPDTIGAH
jgi:hypothetical protein